MTDLVVPCNLMREIASSMGVDTENLLIEQQARWQQIQTIASSLPSSVQSTFTNFLVANEPPLTDALTLRQGIGQMLSRSADLAESVDNAVSKTFQASEKPLE